MGIFMRLWYKLKSWLLRGIGCHYIHGPETLPPPYSSQEESELLSRLEDEYGIMIPDDEVEGLVTVADVAAELEKLTK